MPRIRKSAYTRNTEYDGDHRFEHWYIDNQIYFITARCRDRFPAFEFESAKQVFWDRFTFYCEKYDFKPIITTLLDNHYHTLGYLKTGSNLGPMMRQLHGSVAKLVNDLLSERQLPFWHDRKHPDYFDGCLRDEKQFRLTYRYIQNQSVRHGVCRNWIEYPHTHAAVELERALKRAIELSALLNGVPYRRYERSDRSQGQ